MNSNHQPLSYVPDDGYTEEGFIKGSPGLHGDLRFEFRPFIAEARSKLLRTQQEMAEEKRDVSIAQALVEHLVSWDLRDAKGGQIKVTVDVARRLKPILFYRLWAILLGTEASDLDPEWDDDEATEQVAIEEIAQAMPAPVGVARETVAEKNSEPG